MLFATGDSNLEMFIVLVFIGLLIAKEFTDRYSTSKLRFRMNILILIFLAIFVVVVVRKLMTFVYI